MLILRYEVLPESGVNATSERFDRLEDALAWGQSEASKRQAGYVLYSVEQTHRLKFRRLQRFGPQTPQWCFEDSELSYVTR